MEIDFEKDNIDYKNCSEGGDHILEHRPRLSMHTYKGKTFSLWRDPICCKKCNILLGHMSIRGCQMDQDRKHNIERGTYEVPGGVMKFEHCLTCGNKIGAPIDDTEPFELY